MGHIYSRGKIHLCKMWNTHLRWSLMICLFVCLFLSFFLSFFLCLVHVYFLLCFQEVQHGAGLKNPWRIATNFMTRPLQATDEPVNSRPTKKCVRSMLNSRQSLVVMWPLILLISRNPGKLPINWLAGFLPSIVLLLSNLLDIFFHAICSVQFADLFLNLKSKPMKIHRFEACDMLWQSSRRPTIQSMGTRLDKLGRGFLICENEGGSQTKGVDWQGT